MLFWLLLTVNTKNCKEKALKHILDEQESMKRTNAPPEQMQKFAMLVNKVSDQIAQMEEDLKHASNDQIKSAV